MLSLRKGSISMIKGRKILNTLRKPKKTFLKTNNSISLKLRKLYLTHLKPRKIRVFIMILDKFCFQLLTNSLIIVSIQII